MPANTSAIIPNLSNVGIAKLGTTSAQVKSDGTSAGTGTDLMYCVLATGANGTLLQRVRFMAVASAAAVTSVATTLRIYASTVSTTVGNAAGATTSGNTHLLAEVAVPAVSASNSLQGAAFFDIPFNIFLPTGYYIMASQHIAQTTNQQWQAMAFAADY